MSTKHTPGISVKVEFNGGLEHLFDNKRSHSLFLPTVVPKDNNTKGVAETEEKRNPVDILYLIVYLRDVLLQERTELFKEGGMARPGILIFVNDTDYELEGEADYTLQDGDEIVFISILHGH